MSKLNRMNFRFSIGVVLLWSFFSCQKPPEPETKGPDCSDTQTKYISSEISNFKFKKGTYWVYIDSISLAIDTMRVDTVIINGLRSYQNCPNNFHEIYCFQVNLHYDISEGSPDQYVLDQHYLKLNPRTEDAKGFYNDYSQKIDSLFIYDRYYKSVVTSTLNLNGDKTILYTNSTFGFLRKDVFGNNNILLSKKVLKNKLIIR